MKRYGHCGAARRGPLPAWASPAAAVADGANCGLMHTRRLDIVHGNREDVLSTEQRGTTDAARVKVARAV